MHRRRPDHDPGSHNAVVVAGDPTSKATLNNTVAVELNRKDGAVVFQPQPNTTAYYLYWMPFEKVRSKSEMPSLFTWWWVCALVWCL